MTTYYFVLMMLVPGSADKGYVDTPNRYPSLKFCQAQGISNSQIIGHGVKWKCVKRTETHQ